MLFSVLRHDPVTKVFTVETARATPEEAQQAQQQLAERQGGWVLVIAAQDQAQAEQQAAALEPLAERVAQQHLEGGEPDERGLLGAT